MNQKSPHIAIVGLGLMGGSLGYALKGFRQSVIAGYDLNADTTRLALARGAIDRAAFSLQQAVEHADISLFCSSPSTIIDNISQCLPFFRPGSIVSEIGGVKSAIVAWADTHLPKGLRYVGLHPMAGKAVGGFANAEAGLFQGAGFILVPPENADEAAVETIRELAVYLGAGRIAVNHAAAHDRIIAFSSDLMHISAVALCEHFPSDMTPAHTAGAFRDCTRIAQIDAQLWTELFTANAENILPYLDQHIRTLSDFRSALARGDHAFIHAFLQQAADNKETFSAL